MLFYIASGQHVDGERSPRFGDLVDGIYRNPFLPKKKELKTAKEIKDHIAGKINALLGGYYGSDDASGEDHA